MKVRAITGFLDPGWPVNSARVAQLAAGLREVREALGAAGYQTQTLRLAIPPPAQIKQPVPPAERPELARQLAATCADQGIEYLNVGPALPDEPEAIRVVPEVLAAADNVFCSALYASRPSRVSLAAARSAAEAIVAASTTSPDGFANLRFAALANVHPGSPFFPAAYHDDGPPAVALATEAADLAVESFRDAATLAEAQGDLVSRIEAHAAALSRTTEPIASSHAVRFLGIDFSLAPYPEPDRSIGTALELVGPPALGLSGTAAAAAFLTDCLDRARFPRTGFSGLMLPVLEDTVLAQRVAEGRLGITELLLLSTVCGAGLDTIPLPGDVPPAGLTALLIDLAVLALRHDKPLTARLMPIPGKAAGDPIHFDFPFFADSRVMELPARPLGGLLAAAGRLDLLPRSAPRLP